MTEDHYDNPCDRRDGAGVAMTVSACNNRAYHCDTRQSQSDAMSQWLSQSGAATGRAQRHSGMIHESSPVMGTFQSLSPCERPGDGCLGGGGAALSSAHPGLPSYEVSRPGRGDPREPGGDRPRRGFIDAGSDGGLWQVICLSVWSQAGASPPDAAQATALPGSEAGWPDGPRMKSDGAGPRRIRTERRTDPHCFHLTDIPYEL